MGRYDLTDFEWKAIEPLLPQKSRGVPRVVSCCRFGGHRDKVFQPDRRSQCSDGYSVGSSKLRR